MPFRSGHSYLDFHDAVLRNHRYIHNDETQEFLAALVDTALSRTKFIPEGTILWRAQVGADSVEREFIVDSLRVYYNEDVPYSAERMLPKRNAAREGRVNPKGVPCLYLATDDETAMSEVRPWIGAKISVARFSTARKLRLADCSHHHAVNITADKLFERGPSASVTDTIWVQIDRAFSKPVNGDDLETADYVPTQTMAEAFRHAGFDGVEFKSKLGDGNSVALFDVNAASVLDVWLSTVSGVKYKFDKAL